MGNIKINVKIEYQYRAVDKRDGRVLVLANTLPGLYPESERDWAVTEECGSDGHWNRLLSMRRGPDGNWL